MSAVRVVLLSMLLTACHQADDSTVERDASGATLLSLSPPSAIALSRVIDPDLLELSAALTTGGSRSTVDLQEQADGRFVGRTSIPRGEYTNIEITWRVDDLLVATANRDVPVAADATSISLEFADSTFDISADADADGRSNLDEFDAETDPRSAASPGGLLPDRPLELRFAVPVVFNDAPETVTDALDLRVSVSGQRIPVTFNPERNRWEGGTTAPQASAPFIDATLFAEVGSNVRVAQVQRSVNVADGVNAIVRSQQYSLDFDDNFDGQTNASELIANAPDPGPPGVDACEISNFDTGCNTDSDMDGVPDSVETETADADEDAIPDYLESTLVDADADGVNAQEDVNEADPCSPDNESEACAALSRDTDGDGKLDVDEGNADTDGDGKLDRDESSLDDRDDDGTPDELDEDDDDQCVPVSAGLGCA